MLKRKYIDLIIVIIVVLAVVSYTYTSFYSDDDTVSIGYLPSDHDAALFVANASGMYRDAGLNVELHEYNNGGDLISAMTSGTVDVGYVGVTPVLSSISKDVPIKIVAGAQLEGSGLVTNEPEVTSIEDLKGKSIATPGQSSIQYMLLQYDLKKHDMTMSDITSPSMKVASMNDALKTGSIDAMLTYEPYMSIAEKQNNMTVVDTSHEILENHPCCVVVVTDKFANRHPDKVKKIAEIHKNATEKLENDPYGCVKYLPRNIVANETLEGQILANMSWVSDLNDTYKQDVRDFISTEKDLGGLNQTFSDEKLFYTA